jgi:uncharacterized protein
MKYLVWAAVCLIAVMWLLRAKSMASGTGVPDKPAAEPESGGEAMVRCAYCGVHVPQSEAIVNQAGSPFCCEDHRLGHVSR